MIELILIALVLFMAKGSQAQARPTVSNEQKQKVQQKPPANIDGVLR